MEHHIIKETPNAWPKLKVLETPHSFLDALCQKSDINPATGKLTQEHLDECNDCALHE